MPQCAERPKGHPVAYVATALVRSDGGWSGQELDLDDTPDIDAVVDALRDLADDKALAVLLVEEDDEWMGVVRVDGDGDPRLFISDGRLVERSDIAALLFADASPPAPDPEDAEEEKAILPEGDPGGDPAILTDLGTPAETLLELCAEEGVLPADVIAAVCERAGCLETLEELRGA